MPALASSLQLPINHSHPASCLAVPQTLSTECSCLRAFARAVLPTPGTSQFSSPSPAPPPLPLAPGPPETLADQALALCRTSTDPEGYRGVAQSGPELLQPAPAAPPPGRGQDCRFEDENSVCNNDVPTAVDNPLPSTPLPDQEASSSTTFNRERYSPGLAPQDLQPGRPGHLAVSGVGSGRLG